MTTMPGLSVACQFIYWFTGLISGSKFNKEQVEARQPMIEEIMRPGYEPTPAMLEAVRRACGIYYPTVKVLVQVNFGVVPLQEATEPCIDLSLRKYREYPDYFVTMTMVEVTGGLNRTLLAYRGELETQGFKIAGALNASAYLREMRRYDSTPLKDRVTGEFYYDDDGNRVLNAKGDTGITSESSKNFDVSGSHFLVVRV